MNGNGPAYTSDSTGNLDSSPTSSNSFSIPFSDFNYTSILFTTGDLSSWIILPRSSLNLTGSPAVNTIVTDSSSLAGPIVGPYLWRETFRSSDPIITMYATNAITTNRTNLDGNSVLYMAGGMKLFTNYKDSHNGANVWVDIPDTDSSSSSSISSAFVITGLSVDVIDYPTVLLFPLLILCFLIVILLYFILTEIRWFRSSGLSSQDPEGKHGKYDLGQTIPGVPGKGVPKTGPEYTSPGKPVTSVYLGTDEERGMHAQ